MLRKWKFCYLSFFRITLTYVNARPKREERVWEEEEESTQIQYYCNARFVSFRINMPPRRFAKESKSA